VDTRNKILTLDAAAALTGEIVLATGTFDILQAQHVRQLTAVRQRTPAAKLMAVVTPSPRAPLGHRARCEMIAALRMIDYVVAANDGDVEPLILSLKPAEVACMEAIDAHLYAQLIEHVGRRQNR
jgi:glycerol-3-phosphate cytidylyltransferase-like family protein